LPALLLLACSTEAPDSTSCGGKCDDLGDSANRFSLQYYTTPGTEAVVELPCQSEDCPVLTTTDVMRGTLDTIGFDEEGERVVGLLSLEESTSTADVVLHTDARGFKTVTPAQLEQHVYFNVKMTMSTTDGVPMVRFLHWVNWQDPGYEDDLVVRGSFLAVPNTQSDLVFPCPDDAGDRCRWTLQVELDDASALQALQGRDGFPAPFDPPDEIFETENGHGAIFEPTQETYGLISRVAEPVEIRFEARRTLDRSATNP